MLVVFEETELSEDSATSAGAGAGTTSESTDEAASNFPSAPSDDAESPSSELNRGKEEEEPAEAPAEAPRL